MAAEVDRVKFSALLCGRHKCMVPKEKSRRDLRRTLGEKLVLLTGTRTIPPKLWIGTLKPRILMECAGIASSGVSCCSCMTS